jgi:hypothetical protein
MYFAKTPSLKNQESLKPQPMSEGRLKTEYCHAFAQTQGFAPAFSHEPVFLLALFDQKDEDQGAQATCPIHQGHWRQILS